MRINLCYQLCTKSKRSLSHSESVESKKGQINKHLQVHMLFLTHSTIFSVSRVIIEGNIWPDDFLLMLLIGITDILISEISSTMSKQWRL